jgi:hypothetical protein
MPRRSTSTHENAVYSDQDLPTNWKPIFNLLEGEMTVFLVNAQHIKAVPGWKTDVKDAEWIADLLQHGRREM